MLALPNISALAEKNAALLQQLGFNQHVDDPFDLDNPDTYKQTGLFSKESIDAIFGETAYHTPIPGANEKFPRTIGMLLIRPDMTHISPKVETFISDRFEILDVSDITMTPDAYWAMYSDAIIGRETRQSRLTRAAVYINSVCRLMVFGRAEATGQDTPVANQVFTELKGKQGVAQPGTLRGDLVYTAAVSAGFHNLTSPEVALAVDPFGAYRKITQGTSSGPYSSLTHPLLFFTGVGIHVPDHNEMQRDLELFKQPTEGIHARSS